MKVYLDNSATTMVLEEVAKEMKPYLLKNYGNPSSLHYMGIEAENSLNIARKNFAKFINAETEEVVFTGSATEANNIAIFGAAFAEKEKGKTELITSPIEHSSVINPMKRLEKMGFELTILHVDKEGFVDLKELENSISEKTALVSIIHANHEIGTIQNIEEIGKICHAKGTLFHTDTAQGFTKTNFNVKKQNIDLATFNAHKIHGPKGVGALFIKKGLKLEKFFDGGPQEFNIRPGTENLAGIFGFVKAAEIALKEMEKNTKKISALRNRLAEELLKIPHTYLNGPKIEGKNRLPNNANIRFAFVEGEAILMDLSMSGICVSTGSACSSKSLTPSHVLTSIGLTHEQAHGSIRFSLSKFNTKKEIDFTAKETIKAIERLRKISSVKEEGGKSFYRQKKEEILSE